MGALKLEGAPHGLDAVHNHSDEHEIRAGAGERTSTSERTHEHQSDRTFVSHFCVGGATLCDCSYGGGLPGVDGTWERGDP